MGKQPSQKEHLIPFGIKAAYGSGDLGYGIVLQLISSFLVFYATAVLKMPGTLAGVAVSAGVILDAVMDPVMGYISDRTRFKYFGRRHGYLLLGAIGIAIANLMLWSVPVSLDTTGKFLWLLVDLLILKVFTTIYAAPYLALGADLSSHYNERTSIQNIRSIFLILGFLLPPLAGMTLFFTPKNGGQFNATSYMWMGLAGSILALTCALVCFAATFNRRKRIQPIDNEHSGIADMFRQFSTALKDNSYRNLVLGMLMVNIATALVGSMGMHMFTYTFKMNSLMIALSIGTLFLAAIVSQPIWFAIAKKIDKRNALLAATAAGFTGCVLLLVMTLNQSMFEGRPGYFLPATIITGCGVGGILSLSASMVVDTVDIAELKTGQRHEGVFFGCLMFCTRISQSITILGTGIFIQAIGFDANRTIQTQGVETGLGLLLAIGCMAAFILGAIFFNRYRLNRKDIKEVQEALRHMKPGTSISAEGGMEP